MRKRPQSLPVGTRVDHYVIQQMLSRGGFSFVYLANEEESKNPLVLKEYMPSKLAQRAEDFRVEPMSEDTREHFMHGRKLFLQEASALANLKHPNIVDVVNFFSANGTVYMAMRFERGKNLQAYIQKYRGKLSERFMLTVFPPLLSGLRKIHECGFLHLDIKPGNVHLRPGGNPLLLDFGAVHEIMRTRSDMPTQVVTPGYSPIEQYDMNGYVGPWTDIYAMGATMRTCVEGSAPPHANTRYENDLMRPATEAFKKHYSQELLAVIDWAMEIDPLLRPQTIEQMLDAMPGAERYRRSQGQRPAAEPSA